MDPLCLGGHPQLPHRAESGAAILTDGSIVSWGHEKDSTAGDSSALQDQLGSVQHVQATNCAYAAILADGSVVTWGQNRFGGNSSAVQAKLRNVRHIQAGHASFAATLAYGSVVTWGLDCAVGDALALWRDVRFRPQRGPLQPG
ncbi:unnamed protein product [Symbiodinium natans]|uniref:E3 ubiquitin-protein ligase HERC2 n=1 Tax=Symbiodinium natans TaxID=878477 RepID=A0A812UFL1_9DINO|nr:unnamed protein product [Symbiodinium natans]